MWIFIYIYHKPHSVTRISSHTYWERVHADECTKCGTWLGQKACQNENGVINCKNPGKCLTCGGTWPAGRHFINNGTCSTCGTTFYKISEPQVSYNDDFTHVYIKYIFYPVNSSVIPIDTQTNPSPYTNGGMSHHGSVTKNSDGTYTINLDVIISSSREKASVGWIYNNVSVNGVACFVYTNATTVWKDHQAPVQNDVIQTDQTSTNGWATIKQLTLSGTENLSDIVYLTISDKLTGEKYVTNAAVPVTDGKYSYTCTPSIEGNTNGRAYVVTAKDRIGNTSTKEFVVSKTDGSAPQLKSGTSLTYTDWSTSKNISLSFFDFGAGEVEASLDNQADYKALTKSGEYYIWNRSFGNQAGTTEYTIYVRDALGNANSYTFTVGNTDSNVYSIAYNLNGGSMSGQKTSYTVADSFTLPQPTRVGYTFTGWTGSNGTTAQKTVTVNKGTRGNLSYTANWSANNYYVTFNGNEGSLNVMDGSITKNDDGTATAKTWYDTNCYYILGIIPTRQGYTFKGFYDAPSGGTQVFKPYDSSDCLSVAGKYYNENNIWKYAGNVTFYAQWELNTYTNKLNHWACGMKYGEGNNGDKNCLLIGDTPYTKNYGETYVMDDSWLIKIPNGYYPTRTTGFFTFASNGTTNGFITRGFGYKFTQNDNNSYENLYHELYYRPYDYTITYNLNGGANNNANPSTYNVLYGVSLKAPTRTGYTFTGWYDENGNKVTGINEGCNATFSSSDDLYAKLAARTTGNRTLTAHWSYNPVKVKVPQVLTGDSAGKSQFRVKCDDLKAGNIKVAVPNSFLYKQTGKADVTAAITVKSGNNIITPTNKVCVYNITTKNGLSAGCWSGSFNIGLTLTKE